MNTIVCTRCKIEKPPSEYYKNCRKNHKRKYTYWCKECQSEHAREYNQRPEVKRLNFLRQQKPEYKEKKKLRATQYNIENPWASLNHHYKCQFGITLADYYALLKKQKDCCSICGIHITKIKRRVFDIDHNHDSNRIRGLLCKFCNTRLSAIEDKNWLTKAQNYLRRHME